MQLLYPYHFEDTGLGVGQGTTDGSIISAVSLDVGVREAFESEDETDLGEEKETNY